MRARALRKLRIALAGMKSAKTFLDRVSKKGVKTIRTQLNCTAGDGSVIFPYCDYFARLYVRQVSCDFCFAIPEKQIRDLICA